jgi:hypothetical protein
VFFLGMLLDFLDQFIFVSPLDCHATAPVTDELLGHAMPLSFYVVLLFYPQLDCRHHRPIELIVSPKVVFHYNPLERARIIAPHQTQGRLPAKTAFLLLGPVVCSLGYPYHARPRG